ncbi:hypothetical protein EOM09_03750 [bacterium]|nr:hypothetical protein [bacterium]
MDFLNNITDETIIITSNKKGILKEISKLNKIINVKLMTIIEFKKRYYFDYDEKSIAYLMKKYGFKYAVSSYYLENLIYIQKEKYKNKKLVFLSNLKNELDEQKLLQRDILFSKYLKGKNIIILDNDLSIFDKNMIKEVSNYSSVEYKTLLNPIYSHDTIIFNTLEEEVNFVAASISKLIQDGVETENIKLTNVKENYYDTIEKIFGFYNLKIDVNKKTSIYSTLIGKKFIEYLKKDRKSSLKSIEDYKGTYTYNKIVDLLNDLIWSEDLLEIKEIIIEKMKSIYTESIKQTNLVEVVDYKEYMFKDEYVFMLNFNNDSIPTIYKDEDYITDNIKEEIPLDKTVEKNKLSKELTINIIKSIKNLVITCKKSSYKDTYYPSSLIEEFPLKEVEMDYKNSYSKIYNELLLSSYLDNYVKYGIINKNLRRSTNTHCLI